jgi:hypothetical protein
VGIRYGEIRLRCKLDYRIKSKEASGLFKTKVRGSEERKTGQGARSEAKRSLG